MAEERSSDGEAGRRLRMVLGYDGSGFSGLAPNPGQRTVGGALVEALALIGGSTAGPVGGLRMAGRTDRGVHARAQVVDVALDEETWSRLHGRSRGAPWEVALSRALGRLLAPEVALRSVDVSPPGFDPRRSALARLYRYAIWQGGPEPLLDRRVWVIGRRLEPRLVWLAADALIGEQDFSALCRRPPGHSGPIVRHLRRVEVAFVGADLAVVTVEADSFCQQMVRSLVASLVAAGTGRVRPGDLRGLLAGGERNRLPAPAPPWGLCFWEAKYAPRFGPDTNGIGPVLPWALAGDPGLPSDEERREEPGRWGGATGSLPH